MLWAVGSGKPGAKKNGAAAPVAQRHTLITAIHDQELGLSIERLCELLGVSRSWYSERLSAPAQDADAIALRDQIEDIILVPPCALVAIDLMAAEHGTIPASRHCHPTNSAYQRGLPIPSNYTPPAAFSPRTTATPPPPAISRQRPVAAAHEAGIQRRLVADNIARQQHEPHARLPG